MHHTSGERHQHNSHYTSHSGLGGSWTMTTPSMLSARSPSEDFHPPHYRHSTSSGAFSVSSPHLGAAGLHVHTAPSRSMSGDITTDTASSLSRSSFSGLDPFQPRDIFGSFHTPSHAQPPPLLWGISSISASDLGTDPAQGGGSAAGGSSMRLGGLSVVCKGARACVRQALATCGELGVSMRFQFREEKQFAEHLMRAKYGLLAHPTTGA